MKKINKILLVIVASSTLNFSCTNQPQKVEEEIFDDDCGCCHCTIYLQPFDDFTKQEVNTILPSIKENIEGWFQGEWEFKVLNPKPLPQEAYMER